MENIINVNNNLQFPDGMRVLVVDDSPVCLKYIAALLLKCRYQVTEKKSSREALMLLKQNENKFDIVVTNVHMNEIDGFKLLEAGLEHDIPVIMTSASDEMEMIKKGVRHGAVDFLVKPVGLCEIKNIWQHVYRKNLPTKTCKHDDKNEDEDEDEDDDIVGFNVPQKNKKSSKKRKKSRDALEEASKRERIRWTQPLHDKFLEAVAKLGGADKAVPKKIMEMIGDHQLTRENIASHLQKYRKTFKKNYMGADNRKLNDTAVSTAETTTDASSLLISVPNQFSPDFMNVGCSGSTFVRYRHHNMPMMNNETSTRGLVCAPAPANCAQYQQSNWLSQGVQPLQLQPMLSNQAMQHQPMMHFRGNLVAGNSFAQPNNQTPQQQQQQQQQYAGMPVTNNASTFTAVSNENFSVMGCFSNADWLFDEFD
ncbi:unnamed protein product [Amaranthus hypochondriacus]